MDRQKRKKTQTQWEAGDRKTARKQRQRIESERCTTPQREQENEKGKKQME